MIHCSCGKNPKSGNVSEPDQRVTGVGVGTAVSHTAAVRTGGRALGIKAPRSQSAICTVIFQ